MINEKLNFTVPIKESMDKENDFLIKGVAINETVTRNGTKFIAEELEKSADSLRNKPVLKDHNNSVDSIVGKTTGNVMYNSQTKAIDFEAKITDKGIQEKIRQGLISSVSVGAMVSTVEEVEGEDSAIVRGIDFVELSLVAVPADPNAGFAMAIAEKLSFNNKKVEEKQMVEEIKEVDSLKAKKEELLAEIEKLEVEKLEKFKLKLIKESEDEEAPVEEPEAEAEVTVEVEDETEGEVAEDDVAEEKLNGYFIEKSDFGGVAITKSYDSLNRLSRRV